MSKKKKKPSEYLKDKIAEDQAKINATAEKLEKYSKMPIPTWDYPKIVVGLLLERSISYADEVIPWIVGLAQQGIPFLKFPYGRTDLVRNKMALSLLQSDFTHLLMLDIDHVHPMDIAYRLGRWVIANPDIQVVGGLNFRRSAPYDPCCFIKAEDGTLRSPVEWDQGLVAVDALGTGTILINRNVFTQLEPPWFFNDYSEIMSDIWPGEDMGFSKLCNKAGIKMFVDTTTTSPHIAHGTIQEDTFRAYVAENNLDIEYINQNRVEDTKELASIKADITEAQPEGGPSEKI